MKTSLLTLLQKEDYLVEYSNNLQKKIEICMKNDISCDEMVREKQIIETRIQVIRKEISKSLKEYL